MYFLAEKDKNKIIDFRPLQELNAPVLTGIWTTPQKYFKVNSEIALTVNKGVLGFLNYNLLV